MKVGRELSKAVYNLASSKNPAAKDYGLRDQIQRRTGSVMGNITARSAGASNADSIKFLRNSESAASGVQSQLDVAPDQTYIHQDEFNMLCDSADDAKAKIGGFIAYLLRSARRK